MKLVLKTRIASVLAFALAVASTSALGQTSTQPATTPHPASTTAPVAAPVYESAFKDYQPLGKEKLGDWRKMNDVVERLGGHAGHIKDPVPMEKADTAAKPAAPLPQVTPAPAVAPNPSIPHTHQHGGAKK
jgi:hypothetical protein